MKKSGGKGSRGRKERDGKEDMGENREKKRRKEGK